MAGSATGWSLAVDIGSEHTVVAARGHDAPARVLGLEGSAPFPSVVFAEAASLLTGTRAREQALRRPECAETTPLRALVGPPFLRLGARSVPAVEPVAAVLRTVTGAAARAHSAAGSVPRPPRNVLLTHPAWWGERERLLLVRAARLAGLPRAVPVSEPVAVLAGLTGPQPPVGATVAVLSLGATLSVAVLARTPAGYVLAGPPGNDPDLGGADLDEALYELALEQRSATGIGSAAETSPWDVRERDAVRALKHVLCAHDTGELVLGGSRLSIRRADYEARAEPLFGRVVTRLAVGAEQAGSSVRALRAVVLAGGCAHDPQLAAAVRESVGPGVAVRTFADPGAAAALGALAVPAPGVPAPSRVRTGADSRNRGRVPAGPSAGPAGGPGLTPARSGWLARDPDGGRLVAVSDETVLLAGRAVHAYDLRTGVRRWRGPAVPRAEQLAVHDGLLHLRCEGRLFTVAVTDGSRVWSRLAPGTTVFAGPTVLLHDRTGLAAVDGACGEELWRRRGAPVAAVAVPEGQVAYTAEPDALTAVDVRTGAEHWRRSAAAPGSLAVHAGTLFAQVSGRLRALDAGTGEPLWETPAAGAPLCGESGPLVAGHGRLQLLDAVGGRVLWSTPVPSGSAVVAREGERILLVHGGGLLALDARDGRPCWRASGLHAVPIAADGAVYAVTGTSSARAVVARSAVDGAIRWSLGVGAAAVSELLLVDDLLLVVATWAQGWSAVLAVDSRSGAAPPGLAQAADRRGPGGRASSERTGVQW